LPSPIIMRVGDIAEAPILHSVVESLRWGVYSERCATDAFAGALAP